MQIESLLSKINAIIGVQLELAPKTPDLLTGLMVVKKVQAKYAVNEDGDLLGLNLAGVGLSVQQFDKLWTIVDTSNLRALYFSQLECTNLPFSNDFSNLEMLEIAECQDLRNIDFEQGMPKLKRLIIRDSKLIRLVLKHNFDSLEYLDLSRNQLKEIQFNKDLPNLSHLSCPGNELKNIDAFIIDKLPVLETWNLKNNPLNKSLTVHYLEEYWSNYLPALKKFRNEFGDKKGIKNEEYKIIFVGDGTAGKTCIVNRLIYDEFRQDDSTHGINIQKFNDDFNRYNLSNYILNLWDFAGQDIYHATHRLFLQSDVIYILAWNKATETKPFSEAKLGQRTKLYRNRKIDYWMRYILAFGKGSPVVAVQTSKEKYPDFNNPKEGKITSHYKPLLKYLSFQSVDSAIDDIWSSGYEEMMNAVGTAIKRLERKEMLPAQWVKLKKDLEDRIPSSIFTNKGEFISTEDATIEYEDYLAIAKANGVDEPDVILTEWLVPIGTVFYKKGYFNNRIILSQEWAIRAIYVLFERNEELGGYYEQISDNGGRFTGRELLECWAKYEDKAKLLFVDFMLACGMCYEIEQDKGINSLAERTFIAPEMLKVKRPPSFEIQEQKLIQGKCLRLKYEYDFEYYSYFQQFLVKVQQESGQTFEAYRYGVHIYKNGVDALVEFDEDDKAIRITVSEGGFELFDSIRHDFEKINTQTVRTLFGIGDSDLEEFDKLGQLEKLGLGPNDKILWGSGKAYARDFKHFLKLKEKEVFENKSIPINISKPKVYFSYAWRNEDNPNIELLVDDMYKNLNKLDNIEIKRDKGDIAYGESIENFMEMLGASDLIVVFISEKYLRSMNCMNELYLIYKNNAQDEEQFRQAFLPIVVERIDFSDNGFSSFLKYWKNEREKKEELRNNFSNELGQLSSAKVIAEIEACKQTSDLFYLLKDTNYENLEFYRENNFSNIKTKIEERLNSIPTLEASANKQLVTFFNGLHKHLYNSTKMLSLQLDSISGLGKANNELILQNLSNIDLILEEQKAIQEQLSEGINETDLKQLEQRINSLFEEHKAELPAEILQLWKAVNEKEVIDIKDKVKLKIPIIPLIVHYEKEISANPRAAFKDMLNDFKNGNYFTKP